MEGRGVLRSRKLVFFMVGLRKIDPTELHLP